MFNIYLIQNVIIFLDESKSADLSDFAGFDSPYLTNTKRTVYDSALTLFNVTRT